MKSIALSIATMVVILLPGMNALCAEAQDVPKYKVFERIITNGKRYKNKFRDVTLTAVFTSPSEKKKTFWGFYDGNGKGGQTGNVWKLRFMPDEVGTWKYTYSWSDATPWTAHGALEVSDDGHFLQHHDGTGFFWLGDTAWRLPVLSPEDVDYYLLNRVQKGFNVIQINISNFGVPNFRGERPFQGNGPPWDRMSPNESYWKHVDHIVDRAEELGLYVVLFTMWGRDAGRSGSQFFKEPFQQNYEYGLWVSKRYSNRPNVIWCAAGEYGTIFSRKEEPKINATRLSYLQQLAKGIRQGRDSKQLLTFHPVSSSSSSKHWHNEDWFSFSMIQTWGAARDGVRLVERDYAMQPAKPVLNAEPGYEDRHRYRIKNRIMDDWHLRMEAYGSIFSGAFGYTYGHVTVWHLGTEPDKGTNWKKSLEAPGAGQMKHVRALLESKPILDRVPDNSLITKGGVVCTRDKNRKWAFVYTSKGQPFTVDINMLDSGKARAKWFDPRTGLSREIGAFQGESTFAPPGKVERGNDWVLVLRRR